MRMLLILVMLTGCSANRAIEHDCEGKCSFKVEGSMSGV